VKSGAPQELIDDLAHHVIEIEGDRLADIVNELRVDLGEPVLEDERASFRFQGSTADLAALQAKYSSQVSGLRVRRPNLNDVFLWVTETDALSRQTGQTGMEAAQ